DVQPAQRGLTAVGALQLRQTQPRPAAVAMSVHPVTSESAGDAGFTESNTRPQPVPAHVKQGDVVLRRPLPSHWRQAPAGWATIPLPCPPRAGRARTERAAT